MTFRKKASTVTRSEFQNRVEGILVGAMGAYCKVEVATANAYLDYVQYWRNEFERSLFIELPFFMGRITTKIDRRKPIDEVIARCDSAHEFHDLILAAKKALAVRYLRRSRADLKSPDMETSRSAFWLMVSEAVSLALEDG